MKYQDKIKSYLGKIVFVNIDRPIGFNHKGIIYQQNYGYIEDFVAPDNEFQDAYVIGINEPLKTFSGKVIAIIIRKNDIENKLVVCEENKNYSDEEIKQMVDFQEKYFDYQISRK